MIPVCSDGTVPGVHSIGSGSRMLNY